MKDKDPVIKFAQTLMDHSHAVVNLDTLKMDIIALVRY